MVNATMVARWAALVNPNYTKHDPFLFDRNYLCMFIIIIIIIIIIMKDNQTAINFIVLKNGVDVGWLIVNKYCASHTHVLFWVGKLVCCNFHSQPFHNLQLKSATPSWR